MMTSWACHDGNARLRPATAYAGPITVEDRVAHRGGRARSCPRSWAPPGCRSTSVASKRLFTNAQSLAIAHRDRGCVKCGAPVARCEVHHINFWSNGGRSDIDNGVLLCSGCHHRLHEQRWTLERDGDRYEVHDHHARKNLAYRGTPARTRSESKPACPARHPLVRWRAASLPGNGEGTRARGPLDSAGASRDTQRARGWLVS